MQIRLQLQSITLFMIWLKHGEKTFATTTGNIKSRNNCKTNVIFSDRHYVNKQHIVSYQFGFCLTGQAICTVEPLPVLHLLPLSLCVWFNQISNLVHFFHHQGFLFSTVVFLCVQKSIFLATVCIHEACPLQLNALLIFFVLSVSCQIFT